MKRLIPLEISLKNDRLMRRMSGILAWVGSAFTIMLVLAVWMVMKAPVDYQHGVTGKILYIHVPSAWLATLCYIWMTGCALVIIFRHNSPSRASMAGYCLITAPPIGAIFTLLTLATGSLWGRPAWGIWWVWDARLTAVFMLFVLYLAIMFAHYVGRKRNKSLFATAVLTLFGFVLVPIIKFSAQWWHALHQPTSLWRSEGSAIEATMLVPLIGMALAFLLLFIALQLLALRAHLLGEKLRAMQLAHYTPHSPSIVIDQKRKTDFATAPLPS